MAQQGSAWQNTFGAQDFDDALRIANNTDYRLTDGLYSRTPSHTNRVQNDLVCILESGYALLR